MFYTRLASGRRGPGAYWLRECGIEVLIVVLLSLLFGVFELRM